MEKIIDTLAKLTFSLLLLFGLNLLLKYFEIELGIENKYLLLPLVTSASVLVFYYVGNFVLHCPTYLNKAMTAIKRVSRSLLTGVRRLMKVKWIRFGLIPIILFSGGLIASTILMLFRGEMRSVLTKRHSQKAFVDYEADTLTRGDIAAAVFTADADNLGIIAVRFDTYGRINDDILEFRLKEENKNGWIYVNEYKTDQFQNNQFFPFGFPKIKNSAGKDYLFEIESLQGMANNAVGLSKSGRIIESRYQFNLAELKSNRPLLIWFIIKKLFRALTNFGFWLSSLIYLLPFFGYIALLIWGDHLTKAFSTIEDYFSLSLMIYLVIEIIVQILRLGNEYNWWATEPNGNLRLTSNILLGLTITLGIIVAVFGKENGSFRG